MQHALKTIAKLAALAGLALTAYGLLSDGFTTLEAFALIVFFFWSYIYAAENINI